MTGTISGHDATAPLEAIERTAATRMAQRGLRFTSGRRRVLSILHAADRPLSVDDILHADPALPQSSTYRDLRVLLDAGIVIPRYLTEDRARFETASSRTTGPSVHFVCTECGTIAQIAAGEDIERAVSSATRGAQRDQGFTTDLTQLLARGRCRRCATHVLTLPHDAAGDARSDQ